MPPQLANLGQVPAEVAYLWNWWNQLAGSEPLTWAELRAWAEITRNSLTGWEAEALISLDRTFRRVIHE